MQRHSPDPDGEPPTVPRHEAAAGASGSRRRGRASLALLFLVHVGELFANPRRLAGAIAQVVELGAAHVALALHLDAGDQRRIGLERALDAFAARDLAHDERRVEAAIALGDHDALVGLHALALAFDDAHVDDDGVARREDRDRLAQARDFFLLQRCDDVHAAFSDVLTAGL